MISLYLFHMLFVWSALNDGANGLPFIGIQLVLLVGLLRQFSNITFAASSALRWGWAAIAMLLCSACLAQGSLYVWRRTANQFTVGTTFNEHLNVPGATRVWWGESTYADSNSTVVYQRRDLENLAAYLRQKDQNFFLFPVSTMLYALLGKPSVQPWLFYLEGHSFSHADMPRMDQLALEGLKKYDVRIWVEEKTSFMGEHTQLPNLPQSYHWLRTNFRETTRFGYYTVWERIDGR